MLGIWYFFVCNLGELSLVLHLKDIDTSFDLKMLL